MSNKFELGDRVRVVAGERERGKVFIIDEIDGNDDIQHETPYRGIGSGWHKASELVMVQPRYAKEYAQPVADAPAGAGATDFQRLEATVSELVGLKIDIAEALGLHRHAFLDEPGSDAIVEAIATVRAERDAALAALAKIIYLAPDKQPPNLLTTSETVREGYKLGYEWAQWEDAQIARKAAGSPVAGDGGE